MKIVIVGAGAMGTLFTAFLTRANERVSRPATIQPTVIQPTVSQPYEVILIDKYPDRVRVIRKKGIEVTGSSKFKIPFGPSSGRGQSSKFKVTSEPKEIGLADLIIIFVKAYDTAEAAKKIKPIIGKNTYILTLQNGLNNLKTLSKFFDQKKILAGTTGQGATYLGPGEVFHAGKGETIIGVESREQRVASKEIAQIFNRAGIETKITNNLESAIWSKLVLNSAINPLAALTRRKNGELIKDKNLKNLLCAVAEETSKVAQAKGIRLLYSNPKKKVIESCKKTAGNVNSMLQDILKGKRTEIDYLNGAIVKEARKIRMDAPLNRILWILVKSLEKGGMLSSSKQFSMKN